MKIMTDFPLESKRLEFVPVTESNCAELLEVYHSNPQLTRKERMTTEEVIEDYLENKKYPDSFSFAIREKGGSRYIGVVQFILSNPRDGNPWLGLIMFHREKQGLGYGKEFINILIHWLRENGYRSLHLGVAAFNQIVVPFYEKIGFEKYDIVETKKDGEVICMSYQIEAAVD